MTINFRSKKTLVFGLAIVSLLSIVYLAFNIQPKPNTKPSTALQVPSYNQPLESLQKTITVNFTKVALPTLPQTLNIYEGSKNSSNIEQIAATLATKYGLTQIPNIQDWSNSDQSVVLSSENNSSSLSLLVSSHQKPNFYTGPSKPTLEGAIESSTKLATSLNIINNPKPLPEQAKYFKYSGDHIDNSTSSNFDLVEIPFTETVNNYPFYLNGNPLPSLSIMVGQSNNMIKITVTPQPLILGKITKNLSPLNIDQLKNKLSQGDFQLLDIQTQEPVGIINTISNITISKISLEYRLNSSDGLVIPYFRITGTSTTNDTVPSETLVVTPAIDISKL